MKLEVMSVFPERGWRASGSRSAERQGCELQFKQLIERKADTMKTYILRDPQAVEPQKPLLALLFLRATAWAKNSFDAASRASFPA
jgi:hypothetical protein